MIGHQVISSSNSYQGDMPYCSLPIEHNAINQTKSHLLLLK